MITKADALQSLRPGAQWILRGDDLEWMDVGKPPTEAQLAAEVARLTALEPEKVANRSRAAAYIAESDPLFFKWQRGEATEAEWRAKVDEIKARYPKP